MKKIKEFIKENKTELQVVAYGAVMCVAGLYIGIKSEDMRWNKTMIALGDTGIELHKIHKNKLYTISVLKDTLNK